MIDHSPCGAQLGVSSPNQFAALMVTVVPSAATMREPEVCHQPSAAACADSGATVLTASKALTASAAMLTRRRMPRRRRSFMRIPFDAGCGDARRLATGGIVDDLAATRVAIRLPSRRRSSRPGSATPVRAVPCGERRPGRRARAQRAARRATASAAETSVRSPERRSQSSTSPSAAPRPTITICGTPTSSASPNFTPGETLGRSS